MQTTVHPRVARSLLGTPWSPTLREDELERAWQRAASCLVVLAILAFDVISGQLGRGRTALVVLVVAALAINWLYRATLRRRADAPPAAALAFALLDPLLLIAVLTLDPRQFAFLHPLLFVVIVRVGLRYGLRAMALSWLVAVLASVLVLVHPFWRERPQLTLAFFVLLLLVPAFFLSFVRRIHSARAIDEERARLAARHDEVLARSAFLAKVSHELRSPLQGIVSALDVLALRQGASASGEDEMIQRIRRSSLLLNTHLRDLLTLAKGDAGHLELRPEAFDACALVETVAASAMDLARDKKLALIVDVPPQTAFVIADGARIDQILTNLVINSIRYTDAGQVVLTMQPYRLDERVLHFTVADTGPGIPEAMLPTLLSPDRTTVSSARRGEGSGIGLAIVRTLVDHLGGRVAVTSRLGRGTTFTVDIPAEPVDVDDAAETPESASGRILVVDDDADVADALASVIDELGFECDSAPSVAVAANALASRHYDAAFVDIEMPGRGGAELVEEMRDAGGPNALTRFFAMSAVDVPPTLRARFDGCLRKPIDHASLRHALLGPGTGARPSQPGLWTDAD